VSAIGHEKDAPLLDLVADWRASTPTDAGKRVVPDLQEELTKIGNLQDRALRYLTSKITHEQGSIGQIKSRPIFKDPFVIVKTRFDEIGALQARAHRAMENELAIGGEELESLKVAIRTLSPQSTLDRGYAVVLTEAGEIVRKASTLKAGDHISIKVAEGVVAATTDAAH
jgi:exodeoxyribonuclease VII large subunit